MQNLILIFLIFVNILGHAQQSVSWDFEVQDDSPNKNDDKYLRIKKVTPILNASYQFFLKKDTFVTKEVFSKDAETRSVIIKSKDQIITFVRSTIGSAYYLETKTYHEDDKTLDTIFQKDTILGPFNCSILKLLDKKNGQKYEFIYTSEIYSKNYFIPNIINPLRNRVSILACNIDLGYFKISIVPKFTYGDFENSLFSVSTEQDIRFNYYKTDLVGKLRMGDIKIPINHPVRIGEGDLNELYLKMCNDGALFHCDSSHLRNRPSYDIFTMINSMNVGPRGFEYYTIEKFDELLLKYNLISPEDLISYKKELNFGHSNEGMYRNLLNKIAQKNYLSQPMNKNKLINNLYKEGYEPKSKPHLEAESYLKGEISLREFFTSFKGVYDFKYRDIVESENLFKIQLKEIVKQLLPQFTITIDKGPLLMQKDEMTVSYNLNLKKYLVKEKNTLSYDFKSFYKNDLTYILKQIGADFNLEMIFEIWGAEYPITSFEFCPYGIFICVPKELSKIFYSKYIPFTKENYDQNRDHLSKIPTFYNTSDLRGWHEFDYVPRSTKEKLYKIIKEKPSLFGFKSLHEVESWYSTVINKLYRCKEELVLSLPFIRIQNPYQKSFFKEKPFFKDAFPVLYQMFGNQFNPINLKIVENNQYPYNVEVSFSYLGTNYSFKEHESDLELTISIKIIEYLKSNHNVFDKNMYKLIDPLHHYLPATSYLYLPDKVVQIFTNKFYFEFETLSEKHLWRFYK